MVLFKTRTTVPTQPVAEVIHHLNPTEIQATTLDITHSGAVFNINYNKEDTLMVEKLKAYLLELEAKKAAIVGKDFTEEINEKTAAFRDSLLKETEIKRAEDVAKVDSDIACITGLIEREQATAETEAIPTEPAVA